MNKVIISFCLSFVSCLTFAQKIKEKTYTVSNEISYYKTLDSVLFTKVDSILRVYESINDNNYPIRIDNLISSNRKKDGEYPKEYFKSGIFIFSVNGSDRTDYILIRDKNKNICFINYFNFSNLIQAYLEYIKTDKSLKNEEKIKYLNSIMKYLELYGDNTSVGY